MKNRIVTHSLFFVLLASIAIAEPLETVDLGSETAWEISIDDGPWRKIKVPGGGYNSDMQDKPWIDGGTVKDRATYKRAIQIPKVVAEQVTKIQFGGVNHGCNVYIDGTLIGSHVGPMMPFEVDITNYVKPGGSCELKVQTYPQWHYDYCVPHGFIYEESYKKEKKIPEWTTDPGWISKFSYGITKYARIAVYPQVYIQDIFVRSSVRDKSLTYDVWVDNHSKGAKTLVLDSKLTSWNKDNWQYPQIEPIQISIGGNEVKKITAGPVAWQLGPESYWWPNKPFKEDYGAKLHNLNVTVKDGNTTKHTKTQRFGFVEWGEKRNYYTVNGVRINQISDGTPEPAMSEYDCYSVSPAFLPPTGAGTGCPETWKKYMRLGICANRIHQSTPTEYMMDTADEVGFMLVAETPIRGCQIQKWTNMEPFTGAVKEMAIYGRNHPSVCRYSLLNEGTTEYIPNLIDAILTMDHTRPLVFEDNNINKPICIEGKQSEGHAYAMLHYIKYPKPAEIITGMGEFAWRWEGHRSKRTGRDHPHVDGGLEEFIYYGGDMRRWDIVYFAGWDFINYWPNFLEGMSHEKHAWKQSCYDKDRVEGVDGWNSPVIQWLQKYFHPYLILDLRIHELNKADSEPGQWPQHTSCYKPGSQIERKLEIFNDGLFGSNFTIQWEARWDAADGEPVRSGTIDNITVEPGFHKTINLAFTAPDTKADERKLFVILSSKLEGSEVFKEEDMYFWVRN